MIEINFKINNLKADFVEIKEYNNDKIIVNGCESPNIIFTLGDLLDTGMVHQWSINGLSMIHSYQ